MRTVFAQVTAVERVTHRVVRVTFQGNEIATFVTPFPDQFATLLFPQTHQERPLIEPGFTWEEFQAMPEHIRPIARNYTIRRARPDLGEVDVDFLLHGAHGDGAAWAARAMPGQWVAMWGPRVGYNPRPDVEWQLLAGDETAIPAIAAILEDLPEGALARVLIEVESDEDRQALATRGLAEVTWLLRRSDARPGAIVMDTLPHVEVPDARVYTWAAGELEFAQTFRRFVRRERSVPSDAISAIGYWKRDPN